MTRFTGSTIALFGLAVAALGTAEARPAWAAEAALHTPAALVQTVAGSAHRRITLTERAARRLDIQTAEVAADAGGTRVVPYAAIIYDLTGAAFVYTNPAALTFQRQAVTLARIEGPQAFLTDGPAVGTRVVTIGVSQLYGAEKGVGQ